MITYLIKHEYKSEYNSNSLSYPFKIDYTWKIFTNKITSIQLLYKFIKYTLNYINHNEFDGNILIIYDNCIIKNPSLFIDILKNYDNVKGIYNDEILFIKTKILDINNLDNYLNDLIDNTNKQNYTYIYKLNGKL